MYPCKCVKLSFSQSTMRNGSNIFLSAANVNGKRKRKMNPIITDSEEAVREFDNISKKV